MASRILLADDSITIQKVVNLTFADEGIEVVAVSNGEMAERRLSEINPDLVLADIFMPGKNGYELCQYIKENPSFRHVPVVLLVGAFEPFDQAEARRVRADAHLTKPFESRTLVETVRKLIDNSKPIATRYVPPAPPKPKQEEQPAPPPPPVSVSSSAPTPAAELPEDWLTPATREREIPASLREDAPAPSTPAPSMPAMSSFAEPVIPQPEHHDAPPVALFEEEPAPASTFESTVEDEPLQFGAPEIGSSFIEEKTTAVPSVFGDSSQDMVFDFDRVEGETPAAPDSVMAFDVAENSELSSDAGFDLAIEPDQPELAASSWESPHHDAPPVEDYGSQAEADELSSGFLMAEDQLPNLTQTTNESLSGGFGLIEPLAEEPIISAGVTDYEAAQFTVTETIADSAPFDGALWSQSTASSAYQPEVISAEETEPVVTHQDAHSITVEEEKVDMPASTFTASDMWAVEETKFTPVDFEPVAEEPAVHTEPLAVEEQGFAIFDSAIADQGETGFELAEVIAEESGFAIVQPRVEASHAEVTADVYEEVSQFGLSAVTADRIAAAVQMPEEEFEPPSAAVLEPETWAEPQTSPLPQAASVDLSPSVVDEIVRRVIAEISDAVVREIAWEIVPDYVDRIVDRVARDAVAKKAM